MRKYRIKSVHFPYAEIVYIIQKRVFFLGIPIYWEKIVDVEYMTFEDARKALRFYLFPPGRDEVEAQAYEQQTNRELGLDAKNSDEYIIMKLSDPVKLTGSNFNHVFTYPLSVRNACMKCGAPYHYPSVWHGITPPPPTPTCQCWNTGQSVTSNGTDVNVKGGVK